MWCARVARIVCLTRLPAANTVAVPESDLNLFQESLRHRFRLGEEIEVIWASCFGIGPRHVEAAEWMGADHRTCAFAIQVQIADVKFCASEVEDVYKRQDFWSI